MLSDNTHRETGEYEILKLLKSGHEKAFDTLYEKYSLPLYRRLLRMVKIESVAEELTQEIFLKIWENRNALDPEKSFYAFLIKIAGNKVVDFYRKASRSRRLKEAMTRLGVGLSASVEESLLQKEANDIVHKAIDSLPAQQQYVFHLCKIEGHTYEEVSNLLGISTATVNNHIVRASKFIKHYLARNYTPVLIFLSFTSIIGNNFF